MPSLCLSAGKDRNINLALLGFLLLSVASAAQDLTAAKPETLGLSSERLERIGTAVQRSIDDKRIAGAVTLVVRHGHVAWFQSQGMIDREAGKAMQNDAIFRICSMTKPITSVAVMMLYEEGRFLLHDPVSKYLPEFNGSRVLVKPASGEPYTIPATKEITILDLLRHTSGITYQWNGDLGPMYEKASVASGLLPYDGTIGDSVKHLAGLPLVVQPWRPLRIQSRCRCAGTPGRSGFGPTPGRIFPHSHLRTTGDERYLLLSAREQG